MNTPTGSKLTFKQGLFLLRGLAFAWALFASISLHAATKLYLRNTFSALGTVAAGGTGTGACNANTHDYKYRLANTTAPSGGLATATFNPTNSSTAPCLMQYQTAAGLEFMIWASPPIATSVTVSSSIDYSIYCAESNASLNAATGFVIKRWSAAKGGIAETGHTSASTTECNSPTAQARTIAAATPTSTTFQAGDRILIWVEVRDAGSFAGTGSRTISINFNDTAANLGDTWVNFVDNITFSADTGPVGPQVQ